MDIKFNLNVNVKKKVIFNGKEYGSFDELPEEGKAAIKKAVDEGKIKDPFAADHPEEQLKREALGIIDARPDSFASSSGNYWIYLTLIGIGILILIIYFMARIS